MDSGTYSLVVSVIQPIVFSCGGLGDVSLEDGLYAYTGSARGTGGFSRVNRHLRVLRGEHDVRKWHVDYLDGHPEVEAYAVVKSKAGECEVAEALDGDHEGVEGFGCSDCGCSSHLHQVDSVETVAAAHSRGSPVVSVKSYTSPRL